VDGNEAARDDEVGLRSAFPFHTHRYVEMDIQLDLSRPKICFTKNCTRAGQSNFSGTSIDLHSTYDVSAFERLHCGVTAHLHAQM
jgi:hypothetical protein